MEALNLQQLFFDILLSFSLVLMAWKALTGKDLFQAIVFFIVFGLLMALVWVRLGAFDIAMAEVTIGAGITGALLLSALVKLKKMNID